MNENKQRNTPDYKIGAKAGRTGDRVLYDERINATSSAEVSNFTPQELAEYQDLYDRTPLWHGSGLLQYDDSGEVVNVFESILDNDGFTPKFDIYDLAGSMTSVSLAPDRAYGRLYADTHHTNPTKAHRHGSAELLVGYYVEGVERAVIVSLYNALGVVKAARALLKGRQLAKLNGRWSKKVNSTRPSIKQVFLTGSDIEGNYPILYGIADVPNQVPLSDYLAKHEVRTTDRIDLSQITHIEVPAERVEEIQQILAGRQIDIPVVAIELGEAFMAADNSVTVK